MKYPKTRIMLRDHLVKMIDERIKIANGTEVDSFSFACWIANDFMPKVYNNYRRRVK